MVYGSSGIKQRIINIISYENYLVYNSLRTKDLVYNSSGIKDICFMVHLVLKIIRYIQNNQCYLV